MILRLLQWAATTLLRLLPGLLVALLATLSWLLLITPQNW